MKRTHIFLAATLLTSALIFSSCQEAVFSSIMKDVAEEEATMSGNIISIARYQADGTEFLVAAANGGLRYKLADGSSHGQWKTYSSLPFKLHSYSYYGSSNHEGERILKVLADDEYLYLVSLKETKDSIKGISKPAEYNIYAKKITLDSDNKWSADGDWTEITKSEKASDGGELLKFFEYDDYYYTRFNVFSTNSVKNDHRRVFIRCGVGKDNDDTSQTSVYEYYEIKGEAVTQLDETDISVATDLAALGYTDGRIILDSTATELSALILDSAAYLGSKLYFFNSIAVIDNETKASDSTCIFYGGTTTKSFIYKKGNNDSLYFFDGTANSVKLDDNGAASPRKILSAGEPISCFALCNDALIIGRADYSYLSTYSSNGGVVKIDLEDGILPSSILTDTTKNASKVAFTTNADSQLSSSYEIFTLLNAEPSKDELDSSIYATIGYMGTGSSSSVSANSVGMWAYYPNRGNWNRE